MSADPLLVAGLRGMVRFQRLVAAHAPGGRVIEGAGWVGSVIPSAPDSSLFNAIIKVGDVDWPGLLATARDEYGDGIKWGVWVHESESAGVAALEAAGLVLDSSPMVQVAELDEIVGLEDPVEGVEAVGVRELAAVNEAAYGVPAGKFGAVLKEEWPADAARLYGISHDGATAAVLCCLWVEGDAHATLVATLPDARGRGLASRLMRAALREARDAGCTTTTLEASKAGAPVYNRLGYRDLERALLYECRP